MRNGLFVIFAVALLAGALGATLSVGAYTVTPSTLKPGEEGSISFSITNSPPTSSTTAATELEDVQVFFSPSAGMEFKATSPYIVGTIGSGGTAGVSVPFRVLPSAKGGVILATFQISQKDEPGLKTVNAVIRVVNPPVLTVSSDKQTILSSDTLTLSITNNGGTADRATLAISEGSGFSMIGASQIYVGAITNQSIVRVPIDASGADAGVSQIPFVISYLQEGGETVNETKFLSVSVRKESQDLAFTQEGKVITKQDNTLLIKVKNNGKVLSNFRIFWTDENLKAKGSSQVRLGDLPAGGEATMSLLVFANSEPGVRDATAKLAWVEGGVDKEESITIPVVVTSDADAAIYIEAKPTPIVVGVDHTLSITVSNVGSYKINNVEVTLEDSPAFEIFNAQRSQYIGGLESDDFSSVQYKVRTRNVAPGDYPLTVKVRYKDPSGVWVDKTTTAQLSIRSAADVSPASGNGNGTLYIIVGVAVLAAGYWYFRMRKPKATAR